MTEQKLRLHDTLSGDLRPLALERPGEVRVYCCGPTTYDDAHVGHARAALAPDVLVRYLRWRGLHVTYVRNITDVDDKILARAKQSGEEPTTLSARMAERYQADIGALGCQKPDVEPKVSEHIADIVALVERLVANGAGYVVDLGGGARDVYFAVRAFPGYGKLSKRKLEDLRVGARIEANDKKRDPLDFALWKGCAESEWGWPSPWGKGRPGWHIECSAMSARYLGHGFEVHAGGMDLVFPHHENEIAQCEAAHPGEGDFVRTWIHNGFVNVDKEKMAKSLGNFVTIRDVYQRYDPEALRYFLLTVHYRGPIAFETDKREDGRVVFEGVAEAERRVDYLYAVLERLGELAATASEPGAKTKDLDAYAKVFAGASERLAAALEDDLNTPAALAVVAELAKTGNELCDVAQKRKKDARLVAAASALAGAGQAALRGALDVLGLCHADAGAYTQRSQARRLAALGVAAADVDRMIDERLAARGAKDFARADALRAELGALGIEVADAPTGSTWRVGVV
ncbi:MAG: cysteine--tRNA ligase [Myxococcales bacterium]|nr:cysteine--tRNA ligase [Myxococcales bacterium]